MQSNVPRSCVAGFLVLVGMTFGCFRGEAAELIGTWIINIQDPGIPHAAKVILTFNNENGVIKGVMNSETPLEDIKLEGDQVSFFVLHPYDTMGHAGCTSPRRKRSS